jgi:hypothetical protein
LPQQGHFTLVRVRDSLQEELRNLRSLWELESVCLHSVKSVADKTFGCRLTCKLRIDNKTGDHVECCTLG